MHNERNKPPLLVRDDMVHVIKARELRVSVQILNFSRVFFPLFALLLSGDFFTTKLKNTCKNSGTFEEKKISPEKSLTLVLNLAIQLWFRKSFLSLAFCAKKYIYTFSAK